MKVFYSVAIFALVVAGSAYVLFAFAWIEFPEGRSAADRAAYNALIIFGYITLALGLGFARVYLISWLTGKTKI